MASGPDRGRARDRVGQQSGRPSMSPCSATHSSHAPSRKSRNAGVCTRSSGRPPVGGRRSRTGPIPALRTRLEHEVGPLGLLEAGEQLAVDQLRPAVLGAVPVGVHGLHADIIARRGADGFGTVSCMKIEMSVMDFLDRADTVYRDRVAVVDEPDQPAPSWGELTFGELAGRARAQAAGLDELGVGRGRAGGDGVAQLGPPAHRRSSGRRRLRAGPRADQLPARRPRRSRYIVEHSGASVLLVDPELEDALAGVDGEAPLRDRRRGRRRAAASPGVEPAGVGAGRGRHRAPSTTRAAPPRGPRACS